MNPRLRRPAMPINESLQKVYRAHHDERRKPNFAINEEVRGRILREWIGTGRDVCDLGCRDGQLTVHYLQGNRVIGCEIDPEAAQRARERGIEVRMTDLNQALEFGDGSFDVVSACEVLEHLPYWDISVREAVRVLRQGGTLIGTIPISYHLTDRWRVLRGKILLSAKDPTHVKFLPLDSFLDMMTGYGLKLEEYRVIEGGGPWRSRHPRLFARNIAFRFSKPA
jgi:SAM-dependent methyltransferase